MVGKVIPVASQLQFMVLAVNIKNGCGPSSVANALPITISR